jgi:hypothetical protein
MSPEEREYYRRRAAVERLSASQTSDLRAVDIHQQLACLYETLVELELAQQRPRLTIVGEERQ